MKTVVIGEVQAGTSLDDLMRVYPRHKALVDTYVARGEVIGIGPFTDRSGNLAIFRTREAAERFTREDPFILEGIVQSFVVREWDDAMIA